MIPARLTPWRHQAEAFEFASVRSERGSLLAMDMGTGKSAVAAWIMAGLPAGARVLIACPVSVLDVWPRQIATHAGRSVQVRVLDRKRTVAKKLTEAKELLAVRWSDPLALVIGHEALWREPFGPWALTQDWDLVVIDESHRGSGSPGGKLSRYLGRLKGAARQRLALTGTPLASGIISAYCQGRFVDPKVFGTSATLFRARFPLEDHVALRLDDRGCLRIAAPWEWTEVIQRLPSRKWFDRPAREWVLTQVTDTCLAVTLGAFVRAPVVLAPEVEAVCTCGDYPQAGAAYQLCRPLHLDAVRQEFAARLASMTYQCRAREVLTLPEEVHEVRYCELSPAEARAYRELEKEMVTAVAAGEITASNALVKLLRLAQITAGATVTDQGSEVVLGTTKRDLLADTLGDLPKREPVVVFSRFRGDLDAVRSVCEAQGRVYGELSGRDKDGLVGGMMSEGIDVLGAQLQAGGVGVDLTRARYVVYYSPGFSLSDHQQSLARSCRPGQKADSVIYLHLVAKDTIDVDVYSALSQKKDAVESILQRLGQ